MALPLCISGVQETPLVPSPLLTCYWAQGFLNESRPVFIVWTPQQPGVEEELEDLAGQQAVTDELCCYQESAATSLHIGREVSWLAVT